MKDWLDFLPTKARDKCLHYMRLLAQSGHEFRRPIATPWWGRPQFIDLIATHSVFLPGTTTSLVPKGV